METTMVYWAIYIYTYMEKIPKRNLAEGKSEGDRGSGVKACKRFRATCAHSSLKVYGLRLGQHPWSSSSKTKTQNLTIGALKKSLYRAVREELPSRPLDLISKTTPRQHLIQKIVFKECENTP